MGCFTIKIWSFWFCLLYASNYLLPFASSPFYLRLFSFHFFTFCALFVFFQAFVQKNPILKMGVCTSIPKDSDASSMRYRLGLTSKAKRLFLPSPAKEKALDGANPVHGFGSQTPEFGTSIASITNLFVCKFESKQCSWDCGLREIKYFVDSAFFSK